MQKAVSLFSVPDLESLKRTWNAQTDANAILAAALSSFSFSPLFLLLSPVGQLEFFESHSSTSSQLSTSDGCSSQNTLVDEIGFADSLHTMLDSHSQGHAKSEVWGGGVGGLGGLELGAWQGVELDGR